MPEIQRNILLSDKTKSGYKIGKNADYFIDVKNSNDIKFALNFAKNENLPYFVLGNGSNILASDRGYRGLVIGTRQMNKITVSGNSIRAEAGATLSTFINKAISNGFGGVEELSGIPGTLGGAIYMNAGAYTQTISNNITQICIYDCDLDIEIIVSKNEAKFDYRKSIFQKLNCVILWADFEFQNSEETDILVTRQNEILKKRKKNQPLEYHSCGSVFKRPAGTFAGKLIEEAGLKGFSIGDAEVSEKHANFIVNKKNATAEDVRKVIAKVRDAVNKKFQIMLEPEVVFLGEFDTKI